jgi:hypothetical protein
MSGLLIIVQKPILLAALIELEVAREKSDLCIIQKALHKNVNSQRKHQITVFFKMPEFPFHYFSLILLF